MGSNGAERQHKENVKVISSEGVECIRLEPFLDQPQNAAIPNPCWRNFRIPSWLITSKNPQMSASSTQSTFPLVSPTASASGCVPVGSRRRIPKVRLVDRVEGRSRPSAFGIYTRYLLLADVRRLLDYLKPRQQGYGSTLAFHLANALFQTACRFDELIQLTWADCQAVGKADPTA